MFFVPLSGIP